jgi:hypothetical protein
MTDTQIEFSQEYIKSILDYDSETGVFRWKKVEKFSNMKIGDIAGCLTKYNYHNIHFLGRKNRTHRLAWIYVYGVNPVNYIDHINGDPSDNRICNLREASPLENQRNAKVRKDNKTGYKGVSFNKPSSKYYASCRINGKSKHIGSFETLELAVEAHRSFTKVIHGEFYCERT